MNKMLRSLRIVLSVIFMASSLTMLLRPDITHPMAQYSARLQIIPSLLGMSAGVALFWLAVTLAIGRVYCSSVCPLGTLQDCFIWLRRKTKKHPRFAPTRRSWLGAEALLVFLLCLVCGFYVVYAMFVPWQMFSNIVSLLHPSPAHIPGLHYTLSVTSGVIAGGISLLMLAVMSYFFGREYCNSVCPTGVAMRIIDKYTFYGIEIDPDRCTSCLKCQDICKSRCIDVKSRTVDNSRCVRCFDCIDVCPDDAINITSQRPRAATPLMKRAQKQQNT